jgi:hypothetical protein
MTRNSENYVLKGSRNVTDSLKDMMRSFGMVMSHTLEAWEYDVNGGFTLKLTSTFTDATSNIIRLSFDKTAEDSGSEKVVFTVRTGLSKAEPEPTKLKVFSAQSKSDEHLFVIIGEKLIAAWYEDTPYPALNLLWSNDHFVTISYNPDGNSLEAFISKNLFLAIDSMKWSKISVATRFEKGMR